MEAQAPGGLGVFIALTSGRCQPESEEVSGSCSWSLCKDGVGGTGRAGNPSGVEGSSKSIREESARRRGGVDKFEFGRVTILGDDMGGVEGGEGVSL